MNLPRRNFLRSAGALVVASAFPLPAQNVLFDMRSVRPIGSWLATTTGRWSCSVPELQITPVDGIVSFNRAMWASICSMDYASAELRILACKLAQGNIALEYVDLPS